jgi:hypothetical protein
MSQVLFAPPNVKGWPGGDTWINSSTLLARKTFLDALARQSGRPAMEADAMSAMQMASTAPVVASAGADESAMSEDAQRRLRAARSIERALARLPFAPQAWLDAQSGADIPARFAAAQRVLLALPPVTTDVAEARAQRDPVLFVRAALLDPVYQLK